MWISERPGGLTRAEWGRRALEALVLAVAFAFLPELARPHGAALEPHPGWIAVLLLAARRGSHGFFLGMIAAAIAIGVGSAFAGTGFVTAWSRLDSGPNLIAFGACLAVSWIASWHLRQNAHLRGRVRALGDRANEGQRAIETLQGVVATLRARVDRTSSSLSFMREIAARLEGKDPVAAAEGAADLALARTGALAVEVRVGVGRFQRLLAVRDARGPRGLAPLTLRDADLTVPIRNGTDLIGVIALWGTPRSGLDVATAYDLEVIASWCVRALAVVARRPETAAGRVSVG